MRREPALQRHTPDVHAVSSTSSDDHLRLSCEGKQLQTWDPGHPAEEILLKETIVQFKNLGTVKGPAEATQTGMYSLTVCKLICCQFASRQSACARANGEAPLRILRVLLLRPCRPVFSVPVFPTTQLVSILALQCCPAMLRAGRGRKGGGVVTAGSGVLPAQAPPGRCSRVGT